MTHRFPLVPCAGLLLLSASAQTRPAPATTTSYGMPGRSFALIGENAVQSFQGNWNESSPVLRYVHAHPEGNYVVFADKGTLYRLDDAKRMAEIETMYAPLKELSARQAGLARAQQPLARQQEMLAHTQQPLADSQRQLASQQQHAATPSEQGRVAGAQGIVGEQQGDLGAAQGAIGEQQGQLGAMQGEIGRKQGEIARAANQRMQTMFTQCLADRSCPRVAS